MNFFKIKFILLIILLALPNAFSQPFVESSSGIVGKRYSEVVSYFQTLPSKYPHMISIINYGQTKQMRPLIAIKISLNINNNMRTNLKKRAILLTGAIHGNEYLGFEDKLPEWFASEGIKDPDIYSYFQNGGSIYFIPIYNPDGFDRMTRENANNVDLNRDFPIQLTKTPGFTQPETLLASQMIEYNLIKNGEKLVFSMDYHCCNRSALYPWSMKGAPPIPRQYKIYFDIIGDIMKIIFSKNFRVGNTPDILGYSAIGTSKDYYFERYGTLSFTYEGEAVIEKNKFEQHLTVLKSILGLIRKIEY